VHVREWRAGLKDVRERMKATRKANVDVIHRAMLAIKEVNAKAMARAGLQVEDWSAEAIEREENRLFIGFEVVYPDPIETEFSERRDPLAGGVETGVGLAIDPGRLIGHSDDAGEDVASTSETTTQADDELPDEGEGVGSTSVTTARADREVLDEDEGGFTFIDRDKDA